MKIPFVDLKAQYRQLAAEIDEAIRRVIANADFILGEDLAAFEREFATYCLVKHAVGVDSGGSALEVALRAYGIGPGDEVVTVSHTFVATVSAISSLGAQPALVEIDPRTYTIDPNCIEAAITPRTKAIIPVHLYGQTANMAAVNAIAQKHRLVVIEDACQAHGARFAGRRAGSLGDAACFSFYPGKNLGAYGDGGMVVTSNPEVAEKLRRLGNYGQRQKHHHECLGSNHRLDNLQAAVLRVKLRYLDEWNAMRKKAARLYDEMLGSIDSIVTPYSRDAESHVYHVYAIRTPRRDALMAYLGEHGVSTGLHYPVPVHLQPWLKQLGLQTPALAITEDVASSVLSLPMFPEITEQQIGYVCDRIKDFFGRTSL
jgi:dTDP-4-amino-4,6-dideoxygalactose transaminase